MVPELVNSPELEEYSFVVTDIFSEVLRRLPARVQIEVWDAIRALQTNPRPANAHVPPEDEYGPPNMCLNVVDDFNLHYQVDDANHKFRVNLVSRFRPVC